MTSIATSRLTYLRAATIPSSADPRMMFTEPIKDLQAPVSPTPSSSSASSRCSFTKKPKARGSGPSFRHGSKSGYVPSREPSQDEDGWHIVCHIKNAQGKKPSSGFSITFTVESPKTLDPLALPFVPSHLKESVTPSPKSTSSAVRLERKDDPPGADHGLVVGEQQDGTKALSMSGLRRPTTSVTPKAKSTVPLSRGVNRVDGCNVTPHHQVKPAPTDLQVKIGKMVAKSFSKIGDRTQPLPVHAYRVSCTKPAPKSCFIFKPHKATPKVDPDLKLLNVLIAKRKVNPGVPYSA